MEDDDAMQSPASAGSGSPANGRITVTVALPSPPPRSPSPPAHSINSSGGERQLMLALTSQGTAARSGGGGGGREDCWSESATAVLIEAWAERYLELNRGNLKQMHWKEVADIVNDDHGGAAKTDIQCKNRIDTVKKKYKLENSKMLSGGPPSKWPFFSRLDHLIGAAATPPVPPGYQRSIPKLTQLGAQYPSRNAKKRAPAAPMWYSDSSREASPVSADSFPLPAPMFETKRPRTAGLRRGVGAGRGGAGKEIRGIGSGGEKKKKSDGSSGGGGGWGDSMRELTQAMLRFGEAYENAETAKLQQVVEMEKQRMKFAKELELQRMQFFMKTQMEFSQLKRGSSRRNGNASNHHRGSTANNNSDSN